MLNSDSRRRSAVGRMSRDDGDARVRPFNRPPTIRIETLLVPRLQVALAVVAALRPLRRSIAVGLGFVAGAGLVATGALHQNLAALAIGDQCGFCRPAGFHRLRRGGLGNRDPRMTFRLFTRRLMIALRVAGFLVSHSQITTKFHPSERSST